MSPISIAPVTPAHHPSIQALLLEVFAPSLLEEQLMSKLRQHGRTLLEWVALEQGRVVGHLAYTTAFRASEAVGYHLAPLAICPTRQRQGIASRLILESLESPALQGKTVFVLGDPAYYKRLGFEQIAAPRCPFDQGNQHFLARNLPAETDYEVGYLPEFMSVFKPQ